MKKKCSACLKPAGPVYWEIMKEIGLYVIYCNSCYESVYKTKKGGK